MSSTGVHDAVAVVEERVREAVRRSGIDPVRDHSRMSRLIDDAVDAYVTECVVRDEPAPGDSVELARDVHDLVAGFGPLQRYFDDPAVEEVWINERLTVE